MPFESNKPRLRARERDPSARQFVERLVFASVLEIAACTVSRSRCGRRVRAAFVQRVNTFCQHQEGVSGRHPGAAAEAQHCTSPAPRQPLQASEPCLEAPPLLPGFYQAPRSTGRPIDQSVQPPLGGLPFSSFSVANSSEPMLTSGTTKVGRRRRLHETRMNRCKPALSAPPYTHTAPEFVARQY
jgi:hypothetical protein